MRVHRGLIAVTAAGALALSGCGSSEGNSTEAPATEKVVAANVEQSAQLDPADFRRDMRVLWEDHVAWTRMFIVSAVAGLDDTDATTKRLLQNQVDIGDAVVEFYGEKAGAQLTSLLQDHIRIAGDLIAAAKADRAAQVEKRSVDWYANADEIAEFLAAANPAWSAGTLKEMMRGHLDQTLREATYAASVAQYAQITKHILQMADTLSEGIIAQYPDKFAAAMAPELKPDPRPEPEPEDVYTY